MTSLEVLDRLRFDVSVSQSFDIDYIEANNECDIIKKDLEILEEIREYIKVIDYGEEYQNRYALQVGNIIIPGLKKDTYNKWSKWLGNEK